MSHFKDSYEVLLKNHPPPQDELRPRWIDCKGDSRELPKQIYSMRMLFERGDPDGAESLYIQAKDISSCIPSDPYLPRCYWHLGRFCQDLGKYEESYHYYKAASHLVHEEDDLKVLLLDGLGMLFCKLGKLGTSERYYTEACKVAETLPNHHLVLAKVLSHYGVLWYRKGDYSRALELLMSSLQILRTAEPPMPLDISDCLNNIGQVYRDHGKGMVAAEYFDECLEIRKALLHPNSLDLAAIYVNLGSLLYAQEECSDRAESFLLESLRIRRKVLGDLDLDVAVSYNSLGIFYFRGKEYYRAEECLKSSLRIREALPLAFPDKAASYFSLGMLYQEMHKFGKAEDNLKKGLEIWEKYLPEDHPHLELAYRRLGNFYEEIGQEAMAAEYYSKCTGFRISSVNLLDSDYDDSSEDVD
jgi:tetratricopeptide (TPR) repeat protein